MEKQAPEPLKSQQLGGAVYLKAQYLGVPLYRVLQITYFQLDMGQFTLQGEPPLQYQRFAAVRVLEGQFQSAPAGCRGRGDIQALRLDFLIRFL